MFLLDVPRQPHCGEVSPSQLSDDMILPVEKVSYLHMVIATCLKEKQQQQILLKVQSVELNAIYWGDCKWRPCEFLYLSNLVE